jgi:hypothetical protein
MDNPLVGRVIYRPTARQCRRQRIGAVVSLLLAGYVQLRICLAHDDTLGYSVLEVVFVLPLVLICLVCVLVSMARTVVDRDGICTEGLRRRRVQWRNVQSVDVVEQSGRGGTDWKVRVVTADGKAFKLSAPFDSTNGTDPDFGIKVEHIRDCWRVTTGLGSQT